MLIFLVAIIYMDYIEQQVLENMWTRIWSRYIDDIFFVTQENYEDLLNTANSVHPSIQFTLEKPKQDCPPYRDLKVQLDSSGIFSYSLYVKPIHSGHFLMTTLMFRIARK